MILYMLCLLNKSPFWFLEISPKSQWKTLQEVFVNSSTLHQMFEVKSIFLHFSAALKIRWRICKIYLSFELNQRTCKTRVQPVKVCTKRNQELIFWVQINLAENPNKLSVARTGIFLPYLSLKNAYPLSDLASWRMLILFVIKPAEECWPSLWFS